MIIVYYVNLPRDEFQLGITCIIPRYLQIRNPHSLRSDLSTHKAPLNMHFTLKDVYRICPFPIHWRNNFSTRILVLDWVGKSFPRYLPCWRNHQELTKLHRLLSSWDWILREQWSSPRRVPDTEAVRTLSVCPILPLWSLYLRGLSWKDTGKLTVTFIFEVRYIQCLILNTTNSQSRRRYKYTASMQEPKHLLLIL